LGEIFLKGGTKLSYATHFRSRPYGYSFEKENSLALLACARLASTIAFSAVRDIINLYRIIFGLFEIENSNHPKFGRTDMALADPLQMLAKKNDFIKFC
jgi:hypothetical protein